MRNTLHQITILCTTVLMGLTSCVERGKLSGTSDHTLISGSDTVSYILQSLYEHSPYIQRKGETLDSTYFKASYPHSDDSAFNNLIYQALHVSGEEDLKQTAQDFLDAYNNYVEEAVSPELIHTWFRNISSDALLHTPDLLTLCTRTSEYTGGAHGNYFELVYNYDLRDLKLIALKDLYDKDRTQEFLTLAEKHFRQQEGLSTDVSLGDDYFFDNGVFVLADNFAFTKDALEFRYNPYEIKPWADGMISFRIPYEEIKPLLHTDGLAYVNAIEQYYH